MQITHISCSWVKKLSGNVLGLVASFFVVTAGDFVLI